MTSFTVLAGRSRTQDWGSFSKCSNLMSGRPMATAGCGLYDNSIVAYKTATSQTVSLVLDTIRLAMKREKMRVAAELQLHSDQGFQYTSQAYFNLTKEYGMTPSMSRRGNCYDNAMAENFFAILKTECIYRQKIPSFLRARELIDEFIYFYNHERIQVKTGEAPLARRLSH